MISPGSVVASISRPVIKVGQSSDLTIRFMNSPYPGLYPIKVRGIGGDGKIREAMMIIGISVPVTQFTGTSMQGYSSSGSGLQGYSSSNTGFTTGTSITSEFTTGSYSGGSTIGKSTTYTTPARPFNVTNSSYISTDTYTPIYYTSANTYKPSDQVTPTATYSSSWITPAASYT